MMFGCDGSNGGTVVNVESGTWIHCRAARCGAERGPLDHFEIRVSTNLQVIERTTCCAAPCRATADLVPWRARVRNVSVSNWDPCHCVD
jgi:hypothetical protein